MDETTISPSDRAKKRLVEYFSSVPGTNYERAFYETKFDQEKRNKLVQDGRLTEEGLDYVLSEQGEGVAPLRVIELGLTTDEVHQAIKESHNRRIENCGTTYEWERRSYEQQCNFWGISPEQNFLRTRTHLSDLLSKEQTTQ